MTNNDPIRNPYDPQRPTSDPAMFFGREDVFAFIRQQLVAGRRPQGMAIIGQRGIGKTSVLLQVAHQIEPRYITAYIDLADVRFEEVGGLYAAMADAARLALETAGLSTYRLPPIPEDPAVDLLAWFSESYLDVTLSALRNNRRLIFLFDETSKLLDAIDRRDVPEDFDNTLSSLIARDERMAIIFAVDADEEHRLEGFGPLNDPLLHTRLGMLDDTAAEALIRIPSAPYYEVYLDAIEGILAMTGGHPYLLHVLNGLLWERAVAQEQSGPVTLSDVSAVLRQAVDEADPVLRLMWSRSTPNERQALSALTVLTAASNGSPIRAEDVRQWLLRESDHPLDETALAAALRRLEYREILRAPTKGTYTFTTGLQHQWLVLNGDAPPPTPIAVHARPAIRRFVIPVALLLILAVAAALILGRLATTPPDAGVVVSPTVTLDQNIVATQQSIVATQTHIAAITATFTPSATLRNTAVPTVQGQNLTISPTSVMITLTFTPTATYTSSATFTPTATFTITNTPFPSETPTAILSITPPPFPTGQMRATSTLSP
ncbi:MAG: ATP-binding protein [Chloroflexota bacterium]